MRAGRGFGTPAVVSMAAGLVWWLTGCAGGPPSATGEPRTVSPIGESAWAAHSKIEADTAVTGWQHQTFGARPPTDYRPVYLEGRPAVHAHSASGNSSLRRAVALPNNQQAAVLRFSWWVPRLNEAADLRDRDIDDAVARLVLSFGGDRDLRFTARDHMVSELAQLVTGEPLPVATLMYVWDNRYPVGTVIPNPHTDRIRQLVVVSGADRLGQWVDVARDVQADFRQAFGEAPGPLNSIGLLSDTNNTGATVDAWYGPVMLGTVVPLPDGAGPMQAARP